MYIRKFIFILQIDMEDEREVRREDAAALAKFYNISYIETSSMRGINVEEAFRTITQEVYDKVSPPPPIFSFRPSNIKAVLGHNNSFFDNSQRSRKSSKLNLIQICLANAKGR